MTIVVLFWHGRGDYLMFSPSIKKLREKYPTDEIILCTSKYNAHICNNTYEIAVTNPYVNSVVDWLGPQHPEDIEPIISRADIVLRVEWDVNSLRPRMEMMSEAVGVTLDNWDYDVHYSDQSLIHAEQFFSSIKSTCSDKPIVACSFKSGHYSYDWPHAREFVEKLNEDYVVLYLTSGNSYGAIKLDPKDWPVLDYINLLSRISGFVGFNAGPMHMAVAARIPTVGMFLWGDYFCRYLPQPFAVCACNPAGYQGVPKDIQDYWGDNLVKFSSEITAQGLLGVVQNLIKPVSSLR